MGSFKRFSGYRQGIVTVSGLSALFFLSVMPAYAVKAKENASAPNQEIESLKERLGQLEQRFINMQSRLGTIESLKGQSRNSAVQTQVAPVPSFSSQESGREQEGVRQPTASNGAPAGQMVEPRGGSYPVEQENIPAPVPTRRKPRRIDSDDTFSPFDQSSNTPPKSEKNRRLAGNSMPQPMARRVSTRSMAVAVSPPRGMNTTSPQALYQSAYKMLLKPDYTTAEKGFRYFLQEFPQDKRASNAQYWLGEAYFVQKKYKLAASAYLKGYKRYPNSIKAADSFLKLGVSLGKLGQKQAACATFKAFPENYPNASSYIKRRYAIVKSRAGC